jgi:hypothetical protein
MFAQILRTHWAWTRTLLIGFAVLVFMLPAFIWQFTNIPLEGTPSALVLMEGFSSVGAVVAFVAVLGAFALAAFPWGVDNETRHVYPLSLPITWLRYISMRYAAGALLLIIPAVALWLGSVFALSLVDLPEVLRTYPGMLAVRFLIAMLVAYSGTFALQYLGGRSAPVAALFVLLAVAVPIFILVALGQNDILDAVFKFLVEWPGPFAIFAEPWKLIDV